MDSQREGRQLWQEGRCWGPGGIEQKKRKNSGHREECGDCEREGGGGGGWVYRGDKQ